MATVFILTGRFGKLFDTLNNEYLYGNNNYPLTLTTAYNLLTNWKQDTKPIQHVNMQVNNTPVSLTSLDKGADDTSMAAFTLATTGTTSMDIDCIK